MTANKNFGPTPFSWAIAIILLIAAFTRLTPATPLPINSYSLENGESRSQTYYDGTYAGIGATGNASVSGSFLAGGLGQLTNGAFAVPTDIFDDECIGWSNIQPTVTLDLGSAYAVSTVGFHASNWSNHLHL